MWWTHFTGRITCSLCSHAYLGRNSFCFERAEWDGGVQMDGGRILMGWKFLCGGRILREGLHVRFTRMHIWPVTRFASNG
ncbi:hypothetical protein LM701337_40162 [Listeria monocytogenes]|nr:hypothetical protein LM701337_40162 [Listeria monocytogenes]